ncbi:MAG TPA: hypothetical protein VEU96_06805 [Bryobacteraceae bacterium]|nr:hypothetical protein [Bryobacteraceae bacterium]
MIVTLDSKRRLTVPAGLAPASPGDYVDARFDAEEDAVMFRRLPGKESWLAVLKACPVSPAPEALNWLLDTDVICQPAKRHGDVRVIAWLEAEQDRCYTSAVVIAELAYWVRTNDGRQRQVLQAWLTRLVEAIQGRITGSTYQSHTYGRIRNGCSTRPANICRLRTATSRPPPGGMG